MEYKRSDFPYPPEKPNKVVFDLQNTIYVDHIKDICQKYFIFL